MCSCSISVASAAVLIPYMVPSLGARPVGGSVREILGLGGGPAAVVVGADRDDPAVVEADGSVRQRGDDPDRLGVEVVGDSLAVGVPEDRFDGRDLGDGKALVVAGHLGQLGLGGLLELGEVAHGLS